MQELFTFKKNVSNENANGFIEAIAYKSKREDPVKPYFFILSLYVGLGDADKELLKASQFVSEKEIKAKTKLLETYFNEYSNANAGHVYTFCRDMLRALGYSEIVFNSEPSA